MWQHQTRQIDSPNGVVISVSSQGLVLSYAEVLDLWIADEAFRNDFLQILADTPYTAFR